MLFRRRLMMAIERTLMALAARPRSASSTASGLFKAAVRSMFARRDSGTERKEANAHPHPAAYADTERQDYDTKREAGKGHDLPAVYADTSRQDYDTALEAGEAYVPSAVYADTEQADHDTALDAGACAPSTVYAETERADHATRRVAVFEANRHSFLSGHESDHETAKEAASAGATETVETTHEGGHTSRVAGAVMALGSSITDFPGEYHWVSVCFAGLSKAAPMTAPIHADVRSATDGASGLFVWLAPIMEGDVLYIRGVYENPDESETIIHIE